MPRYDLAVIGGGPAGTAAAWQAARAGLSVALYDAGAFPRDKVCGEFISAEALPLLAEMIPAALSAGSAIGRVEFASRAGRAGGFALPRPALGLSRRALDHALWQAAGAAGCALHPATPVRNFDEIDAGAVILAAGRWWRIAGLPAPPSSVWAGVKCHLRGVTLDGLEMHLFPGGYCGLAPVEGGALNACCLVHREHLGAVHEFLPWLQRVARSRALAARLACAAQATATIVTAPVALGRRMARVDGILLAGDAAGFFDPFAGDGLSRALNGGRLAAQALAARDDAAYAGRLRRAARGWGMAAALRGIVRAPAAPQAIALAILGRPPVGPFIYQATRCRAV